MTVDAFLDALTGWAELRPDVRAVILVGSQARTEVPADEYSDVDVVIFAHDPAALLDDTDWLNVFGRPILTFLEPTPVANQLERRVLFDDGLEVDFSVLPADGVALLVEDPGAAATVARGYRILHDDLGLAELFSGIGAARAAARDLADIAQDFWYHAIWTAKKWRRGEAIVARSCLEAHLKPLLLEADRLRAGGDTWHGARFAEIWATPEVLDAWWTATARSPGELPDALARLCEVFAGLAPHEEARGRLEELLA